MRLFALLIAATAFAQPRFNSGIQPFITVNDPVIALVHVRVIDGTGAPPVEDQTILIDHGKIAAVGKAVDIPASAKRMDFTGHTVIPGLVGMHEHLFYPSGEGIPIYNEQGYSFPRLYLASGVTTARTAGSMEPYTDVNIKALIDAGKMPGPHFYITGPYLEGENSPILQAHYLRDAEDARRTVEYWASEGATSFKAYMNITRAELSSAVETAHKLGLKVTTDSRRDDHNWWVGLALPEGGISVILTTSHENMKPGTMKMYFTTSDVAGAHQELSAKGAKVSDVNNDLFGPGSGVKWFSVADPDGNQVMLVQSRGK